MWLSYSDIKERIKKTKDEKKAKKAEFASKQQKIQAKIPKAAAKGGPKLGGGGGKRWRAQNHFFSLSVLC